MLTIEKLAPYLPYDISVKAERDIEIGDEVVIHKGSVFELNARALWDIRSHLDKVKPILYPFRYFGGYIPWKTAKIYPLVELAKLAGASPVNHQISLNVPQNDPMPETVWARLQWGDDRYVYFFMVRQDWCIHYYRNVGLYRLDKVYELQNIIQLADTIRKMKFAVGMGQDEFIEMDAVHAQTEKMK